MTPAAIFAALRRGQREPVPTEPTCGLCRRRPSATHDDGPPRCAHCIRQRGSWAADPLVLPEPGLIALWSAHEDVMGLRRNRRGQIAWEWIGWPADPDALVDPDAALRTVGAAYAIAVAHS